MPCGDCLRYLPDAQCEPGCTGTNCEINLIRLQPVLVGFLGIIYGVVFLITFFVLVFRFQAAKRRTMLINGGIITSSSIQHPRATTTSLDTSVFSVQQQQQPLSPSEDIPNQVSRTKTRILVLLCAGSFLFSIYIPFLWHLVPGCDSITTVFGGACALYMGSCSLLTSIFYTLGGRGKVDFKRCYRISVGVIFAYVFLYVLACLFFYVGEHALIQNAGAYLFDALNFLAVFALQLFSVIIMYKVLAHRRLEKRRLQEKQTRYTTISTAATGAATTTAKLFEYQSGDVVVNRAEKRLLVHMGIGVVIGCLLEAVMVFYILVDGEHDARYYASSNTIFIVLILGQHLNILLWLQPRFSPIFQPYVSTVSAKFSGFFSSPTSELRSSLVRREST